MGKFKKGDKVKIKPWEEFVKMYNIDVSEPVSPMIHVVLDIKNRCGTTMTIKKKLDGESYLVEECPWAFTEEMIEC